MRIEFIFIGEVEEIESDRNHVADDPVVALDKALQVCITFHSIHTVDCMFIWKL